MVVDDKLQKDGLIDFLYKGQGVSLCCIGTFIIIIVLGVLPSIFLYVINIWLILLVWIGVISLIIILHYILSKVYCKNCKKFVHPIFSRHICELYIKDKKLKLKKIINNLLKDDFKRIDMIIKDIEKLNIFNNDEEKEIFKRNMNSLQFFESIGDYKYCMVAMGSIIEFLIEKYCILNSISPEPYTNPFSGDVLPAKRKKFANYVQSAILKDILGQKNSWFIIQNNLRNFRNYVHINKEVNEENIDINWFKIIKPAFDKIINSFR